MHTLSWPDLLVLTTMLLTQLVGSSTLDRTRRFSNRFNSPLNLSLSAGVILWGGITLAVLSRLPVDAPVLEGIMHLFERLVYRNY